MKQKAEVADTVDGFELATTDDSASGWPERELLVAIPVFQLDALDAAVDALASAVDGLEGCEKLLAAALDAEHSS